MKNIFLFIAVCMAHVQAFASVRASAKVRSDIARQGRDRAQFNAMLTKQIAREQARWEATDKKYVRSVNGSEIPPKKIVAYDAGGSRKISVMLPPLLPRSMRLKNKIKI